MIAYVDSSVILRLVLGQPDALAEWGEVERGLASTLVELECLRTLDRIRLDQSLADDTLVALRDAVYRLTSSIELIEITRPVLARASQPMPIALGSLDAIHLASALLWTELGNGEAVMATHDRALAQAAKASGLRVIG